jgi:hypothetical protein
MPKYEWHHYIVKVLIRTICAQFVNSDFIKVSPRFPSPRVILVNPSLDLFARVGLSSLSTRIVQPWFGFDPLGPE